MRRSLQKRLDLALGWADKTARKLEAEAERQQRFIREHAGTWRDMSNAMDAMQAAEYYLRAVEDIKKALKDG